MSRYKWYSGKMGVVLYVKNQTYMQNLRQQAGCPRPQKILCKRRDMTV